MIGTTLALQCREMAHLGVVLLCCQTSVIRDLVLKTFTVLLRSQSHACSFRRLMSDGVIPTLLSFLLKLFWFTCPNFNRYFYYYDHSNTLFLVDNPDLMELYVSQLIPPPPQLNLDLTVGLACYCMAHSDNPCNFHFLCPCEKFIT